MPIAEISSTFLTCCEHQFFALATKYVCCQCQRGFANIKLSPALLPFNFLNVVFCSFRLKERLGCNPSDEQLATSLRISPAELKSKLIESSLAREKLAMSNVRLVMSIAQRYDNMGAEMADLVQVFFSSLN